MPSLAKLLCYIEELVGTAEVSLDLLHGRHVQEHARADGATGGLSKLTNASMRRAWGDSPGPVRGS